MLCEYGLDPIAIDERWTDEMFLLMLEKMADRKRREAEALDPNRPKKVSDTKLFSTMGIQPEAVALK